MNNILSTQVLFIDAAVADVDTLLAQVDPAIEVIRLEAGQDGLMQIAQALAGRSGIEAVHVVSHGGPGALTLGGTQVDAASLEQYADAFTTIRQALTDAADLLLYGCNVAQGDAGEAFISALAEATGADVAASENLTGASWLGGDWVLEAATGDVEAAAIAAPAMDTTLYSSGGIFNNGYIKFGWSHDGTFGYGSNKSPGIFYDTTGTGNFPSNADFLTPGSPFEFFAVKIGSSTYVNNNTSYTSPRMATTTDASGVVTAGGKTYGTLKFVSTVNGLEITQTYTLGAADQVISISVSVRNTTAATLYGVKYARGIDPDVDSPLGTTNTHNVRGAGDIAASDIVLGTGPISNRVIGLYTNSSMTHNTSVSPGWSTDPAALLANSSNNFADSTINIAFDVGDLAAGQTKNFSLAYVFAANAAALEESVAQVPASNPPPTLTDFAAPVDTVAEDNAVELTVAELAAQGNEADLNADATPGSVTAFVVKAVSSGTLKIGTSAETAVAWAPSSNDVINGTLKAYWTPAANANGDLAAFTVVARDAEGAVSTTPVPVRVTVAAVNDAPTLASDAVLPAVLEDAAVNAGASIASIFTPRFADVDAGDTLGGIVVVGSGANPAHGLWQYSTDGGATWHDVGAVSANAGLVLSEETLLRFAPEPNWNGTPGGLTVHAADSAYAGGYTDGADRATFDTTTDAPTSGVSADPRTLDITGVTAVNDAPVFTSAPATATRADTDAFDTALAPVTGTLVATDPESDAGELAFSVRGGTESGGTWTRVGLYGTLTVDEATGAWTYTPDKHAAINALPAGASVVDAFDFKVADPQGAYALQSLAITLTGSNDAPVLSAAIADQTFAGGGAWTYQVPAATFTDAEGTGLAYTATLDNGDPLPAWLGFDPATRTFSGNPPASWDDAALSIRVTATDDKGASVSDTFGLALSGTANQPPVVANPLTWTSVQAVKEVTEVTFTGTLGGTTLTFAGETVELGTAATGADVAAALNTAFGADADAGYTAAIKAGGGNEHVLVLTAKTPGARADFTDGATVNVPGGSYTVDVTTEGAAAVAEVVTAQFKARPDGVTGFDFGSLNIDLSGATTAEQVAAAVLAAINGDDGSPWTAAAVVGEVDKIRLTAKVAGAATDLAPADFAATVQPQLVSLSGHIDGDPGIFIEEQATLTFGAASGATSLTFDGVVIPLDPGASAVTVAAAFAAAMASHPTWMAVDNGNGTVELWAQDFVDHDLTAASFVASGPVGLTQSIAITQQGANAVTEVVELSFTGSHGGADITLAGVSASAGDVVSADDVAAAVAALEIDGLQFSDAGGGTVAITASVPGNQPDITSGDFGGTYTGSATPVVTAQGSGWSYAIPADTFIDPENDALTYSAYTVDPATGVATLLIDTPELSFDEVSATLSGNGLLPGNTLIEIRAQDAISGATVSSQFQLVVHTDGGAASLVAGVMPASVDFVDGAGSGLYTLPAAAFDHLDAPDGALSYTATLAGGDPLPDWLLFDGATATFSGNPPAGATSVEVQVTASTASGGGLTATQVFTLAIDQPNDALVLSVPPADQSVAAGDDVSIVFTKPFTDPDGGAGGTSTTDGITYTATANGLPLSDFGLTLAENAGGQLVISGNAPGGTPSLVIVVTGTEAAGGTTASASFTLALSDPAADPGSEGTLSANNPGEPIIVDGDAIEGHTLTARAPVDADGYSGPVTYQWQVSDNGTDWFDIAGARGALASLTLEQSEAGRQVRVQAFYNDDGGTAEAPVSTALAVANVDDAGSVSISGGSAPGQTLSATFGDPDGVATSTPAYQWLRDGHEIVGATYSAYTLTADDGGSHISVRVTYTDDHGTPNVITYVKPEPIQLGAVAPVAANDAGTATEAGGLENATPGSNASGNLLANDSDANAGDTLSITGLRMGAAEGLGRPAAEEGGDFVVAGDYGTLRVNKTTGAYTYTVAQDNDSVQALRPGDTLQEVFNYSVGDSALLNDTATLTITINGANDLATVAGIAGTAVVAEDVPTALPLALTISDPDGSGSFALRLHVDAGTLRAASTDAGVVVTGSDTGTLTVTAGSPFALQGWLADNQVLYITEPNVHGSDIATLTYSLDDGSGAGFVALPGTTAITSTDTNDAAIVDLDGATSGNNYTTTFRPRGSEVAVVADSVTITDIDPADGLMSAVVTLAGGDFDNAFGTVYETLRSTAGDAFAGSLGTIAITGNGTGHNGLTGATQLTFTGAGTQADYQDALKTVFYNNANPNAFSGDRKITVTVSDSVMQESDASLFSILVPNADIAIGQRIFIDGEDSGYTVASKVDDQHFVASGPLAGLDAGSTLTFYSAGVAVTSATQSGPTIATTTVLVPWTPVIDMSGESLAGRDHGVTYTEGQPGVAIAMPDASITDQDGNIATVTVTLANPVDGAAEQLFIAGTLVTQLAAMGIAVAGNGTHQITLSGDKDATFFQIGLRGIQYTNTADDPDADTQRIVEVTSEDVDGNTGVGARTLINLVAVNDAPTGADNTLTTLEDHTQVLGVADFGYADVEGDAFASITVISLPGSGSLMLDGVAVTAGQRIVVADIAAGKLAYVPAADASGAARASFQFKVQDDGGTANGGVELAVVANTVTFDITPVNDAPVMEAAAPALATITEDDVANAGHRVSEFVGAAAGKTGASDVDALNNGGAGYAPEAVGQGIAIHALSNDGPATGGRWEYSLDDGASWTAVGAVGEDSALLLASTDRIRFVPDGENGTTARFSYYLWDGATGTAGDKADAGVRGGTSAYSEGSDTAHITVTPVNDAATIDLNGADAGTGYTTVFRPRGDAVAVVADGIVIGDVDRLDADTPDTLASATVRIAGGALDNLFGTTFETLRSTVGTYEGSLGAIAITGNGTGEGGLTGATELTLTGAGTPVDYAAALKTVEYHNANPNAYSGNRTIEITVRDASVSTGDAADGTNSAVATTTIQVPWTPVVDMNGDAAPGRHASVVYTEGSAGVAIAAADASIVDQDGNIASVTVTLTNPLDGAAEKLSISTTLVTQLASVGLTISGNGSHAITLSGNRDGTVFQLALRAIRYVNESDDPDTTPRVVNVESVDMQGNTGVGAHTVINVIPVNDAPQGVDGTVTLDEDTSHAFALGDFGHADAEGDALAEVIITALPATGSLTLDGVAVSAGQAIAAADIVAGKLVYTPVADANGTPATQFTFQVRDAGGTANGGSDLDASPNTLTLDIEPVNDEPTGSDPDTAPSVALTGSLREGATVTAAVDIADVDRSGPEIDAALAYQWQSRAVPDGAWEDIVGATGGTHVLTPDDTNREIRVVVTYTDVVHPESSFTYASDRPGRPAIAGDVNGDITLVLDTDTPVLVYQPEGDVTVTNTGNGPLTVDGLPHGGTVTVSAAGDTTVSNPEGDVSVVNHGPGTVTVTELGDGETVDVSGNGPTTVADPHGDLTIVNAGPGTVTATGVDDGSIVTTSGNGPITIDDPDGSLELVNQGPGPVTVEGVDDGETLVVGGPGTTTVSNPDGDLTLTANGPGYVTVTNVADGAAVTTSGTGDVHISQPQGSLDLVNNQSGGGDVFVDRPLDGAELNISGSGPTTVTNPAGDLVLSNDGPGLVTAKCVLDGKTVTTSGDGPVRIDNPRGSLTLLNEGPGTVTVDGINAGRTIDVSGEGPTTVANPDGDVTIHNAGPATVTATNVSDGAVVTTSGEGPIVIDGAQGDVTLVNQGPGRVTGTGFVPDSTVTLAGDGPSTIDLAGFPPGAAINLDNGSGSEVEVLNAPAGATVRSIGDGDVRVLGTSGDIHVHNDGAGTVHVEQVADDATVTKTGSGPAVVEGPLGDLTLDNDDSGLVTVLDLPPGATLTVQGSGPVAVPWHGAAGERITVDTSANSNVQLSNTGAGTIDVVGGLRLDDGDPMRITLGADGATAFTVAGEVALDGTALDLALDADYVPQLGDQVTLIDNDGADAVVGHFAGLPEGAPVYLGGQLFRISYAGGSGNDVVLTRVNDTPTGSVTVSGTVAQGETLVASHSLADTDGLGTVRYQWLLDGAMVAVGSSYVVTQAAVGKAITVVATYTDAQGTEESVSSVPTEPVANVNDAPTGSLLIGGTAALGQSLVVTSTLADADGMGPVSYQWQADGVDIAGATGDSLRIGTGEIGKLISVIASYTDAQGTLERVVASAAVSVADGNGVAPEIESQVPSLGGGASGDGNGDGVADTMQPAVVSAALAKGGDASSTFATLVVDSVNGKVKEGSTSRLVDFKPADAPSDLPSWAELPAGEIAFTAHVEAPGVTKNFSLYVDADLGVNGYWAKNADGVLVNLASEAYGGAMVREGDKIRLDFQITEGGEFDLGPAGDTSIAAAGAAGYAVLGLLGHTVDMPDVVPGTNLWD